MDEADVRCVHVSGQRVCSGYVAGSAAHALEGWNLEVCSSLYTWFSVCDASGAVGSRSAGWPCLVMHTWCPPVRVGYDSRASDRLANRISSEHFFYVRPFCAGNSLYVYVKITFIIAQKEIM